VEIKRHYADSFVLTMYIANFRLTLIIEAEKTIEGYQGMHNFLHQYPALEEGKKAKCKVQIPPLKYFLDLKQAKELRSKLSLYRSTISYLTIYLNK
jgi:hypothetical protein